ncbi:MAG: adenylosuccinate lyase [Pseudomonadota bacterium]
MIRVLAGAVYRMTDITHLSALSPLDGRYASKVDRLRDSLSEYALIKFRVFVEARWLRFLVALDGVKELPELSAAADAALARLETQFTPADAERVKAIEATTNHDVKACEYFIREQLDGVPDEALLANFIHFGCTSEDINNLAYALMLEHARSAALEPAMARVRVALHELAAPLAATPMLSRTHGQPASPTTMGKEIVNVAARFGQATEAFLKVAARGKFNGAVGNFAAHAVAYPEIDWPTVSARFVGSLGLQHNPLTTQIEPHDWIADYAQALVRYATIAIDFSRDIWGYISLGYFRQRSVANEVGSSTMPHKVNPIDFENAEGNFGIATALLDHLAVKLPISRWQRDLSDSTTLRNLGPALGHFALALTSLERGLGKLDADADAMAADLGDRWEILAEAVQTVMRRFGLPEPYEQLKAFTRGQQIDKAMLHTFIDGLDLPPTVKQNLLDLTPLTYSGYSYLLAKDSLD